MITVQPDADAPELNDTLPRTDRTGALKVSLLKAGSPDLSQCYLANRFEQDTYIDPDMGTQVRDFVFDCGGQASGKSYSSGSAAANSASSPAGY